MKARPSLYFLIALLLLGAAVTWLGYGVLRPDLGGDASAWPQFLLLYGLAFGGYAYLVQRGNDALHARIGMAAGVLLRVGLVFALPHFSDDFYRFVWDGRMGLAGHNPFAYTPTEFLGRLPAGSGAEWQALYGALNSKDYYSVYPPVMQGVFALAAALGGSIAGTVVALKAILVLAECGSLWFMHRISRRFQLPHRSVLIYALNPLVILELTGNLHFEALMTVFLLGLIWMLMLSRPVSAAVMMAFAIMTKILPVLAFPFLVRRIGWGRSLLLGAVTAALVGVTVWLAVGLEFLPHIQSSLRLYFNRFEFNAGVYYVLKWLAGDHYYLVQRYLPMLVGLGILAGAWRERDRIWRGFAAALLFALACYQLSSPVVHPWYITPLVALCALGPFRFPVVWTLFLPLTYLAYSQHGVEEQTWVIALEYVCLGVVMLYEWVFVRKGRTLESWMRSVPPLRRWLQATIPARLKIKQHRIAAHLQTGVPILDLGAGHGGLCKALRADGLDVHPVDVKDGSFFEDVRPQLYDGERLPFADGHFDSTLLITVLHHTPDPDLVLREAMRVTRRRLVVMEDIYTNPLQRYLTYFTDSLVNLEFHGHPHTNRSDRAWRFTFERLGWEVESASSFRTLLFFRQVIYVLRPAK